MAATAIRCFECNRPARHGHHVVPAALGGKRTIPLCERCHGKVHSLDLTDHGQLTRLGIRAARRRGVRLGRPHKYSRSAVRALYDKGFKAESIGQLLGLDRNTVRRLLG